MQVEYYVRRPFAVEAVRVTVATMFEVAEWCKGEVVATTTEGTKMYVKVTVQKGGSHRPTTAFPGDWVVKSGATSFRVYSNKTFHANFMQTPAEEEANDNRA